MKHTLLLIAALFAMQHASAHKQQTRLLNMGPERAQHHVAQDNARGAAPANDACANAETIAVTTDCITPTVGDNTAATQDGSMASCDGPGTYLDVWYVLNPGAEDTVSILLTPADYNAQDWNFAVYSACGGSETYCVINPAVALDVPVLPNANNWIRVWANAAYAPGGPFTLCVRPALNIPAPPNDVCTAVAPQPVAMGGSVTFNGNNIGAINNEAEGVPCVWEAFSIPACGDVHISYCGTPTPYQHYMFPLYTDCAFTQRYLPGSYTQCTDSNFTLCYSGLPAGTYHYPILEVAGSMGPYTLTVSLDPCGTDSPGNDNCDGAIALTTSATCTPQTFSPSCATESMPAITCDGSHGDATDDVWYSFVATQTDMTIGVMPHGTMDPAIEVFTGTCGALAHFDCVDVHGSGQPDTLPMTGLSVGTTYYLRVYDFRVQYAWADPSYDLCVVAGTELGLGEIGQANNGVIFPNPNNGIFSIALKNPTSVLRVDVIDATGRLVRSTALTPVANTVNVDAAGLPQGAYVVRYADGAHTVNERMIIQ